MTGPAVRPASPNDPTQPHLLTGAEWEAAQYAPRRLGTDPNEPMAGGRILTGAEWDQAQRAPSFGALTFSALPKIASDVTRTPASPQTKGTPLPAFDITDPSTYAAPLLRQIVNPTLEHPVESTALGVAPFAAAGVSPAAGIAIGAGLAGTMAYHIAQYGWQKAHELALSPEDRAKAEADPNRVSGESAAVQALLLGLGPLIHVGAKAVRGLDVSAGMMDAGAQGVAGENLGPTFRPGFAEASNDAARTEALQRAVNDHARQLYFETPKGAEVLGTMAAQHGMPETASPYPPATPLDAAWKDGHATVAPSAAPTTAPETPTAVAATETPSVASVAAETPTEATPASAPTEPAAPAATAAKAPYAPTGKTVPSIPIRDETGSLQRNLGRVATEDLQAEWQRLAELNNTEEAMHAAVRESAYRTDYEALPRTEKLGHKGKEDLPDADGAVDPERLAADNKIVSDYNKSAVVRAARTKAMARIEAELAKRPSADEFTANAGAYHAGTPGQRPLIAPVEGTGPTKTRGLSLGVEQKAIANQLTDYLGDLPQYATLNMQDQAGRALTLIDRDPALARKVAMGETSAPEGLHPISVFTAVENRAIAEGDVATIRDLASSRLTEDVTTAGQTLRVLRERNQGSPVKAIRAIEELRGGVGAESAGAVRGMVDELKVHLDEAHAITPSAWEAFINSIRC